jgi:hypothetical protein
LQQNSLLSTVARRAIAATPARVALQQALGATMHAANFIAGHGRVWFDRPAKAEVTAH